MQYIANRVHIYIVYILLNIMCYFLKIDMKILFLELQGVINGPIVEHVRTDVFDNMNATRQHSSSVLHSLEDELEKLLSSQESEVGRPIFINRL